MVPRIHEIGRGQHHEAQPLARGYRHRDLDALADSHQGAISLQSSGVFSPAALERVLHWRVQAARTAISDTRGPAPSTSRERSGTLGSMSAKIESDEALLSAWLGGDRKAGHLLFERYYDAVAQFFYNKVGDQAGDLIQRTFLGCIEAVPRFRGHSSFRSYLFAIAFRQLCRYFRDRNRERCQIDFTTESLMDLEASLPSAPTVIDRREEIRLLFASLRKLPLEAQVLIELYYWEGLTTGEIAEVLSAPAGTIRTRLMRARQQLDENMREIATSPSLVDSTQEVFGRWVAELRGAVSPVTRSNKN